MWRHRKKLVEELKRIAQKYDVAIVFPASRRRMVPATSGFEVDFPITLYRSNTREGEMEMVVHKKRINIDKGDYTYLLTLISHIHEGTHCLKKPLELGETAELLEQAAKLARRLEKEGV